MKIHAIVWVATATLGFGACGGRGPVQIDPDAAEITSRWTATLVTPTDLTGALQVQGTGWMGTSTKDSEHTRTAIQISNAAPGGKHPWHVHRGRCGNDLGIFGAADAYPILEVDKDGRASANATLDVPLPTSGDYFINVHASPTNPGVIIACGNLAPPVR